MNFNFPMTKITFFILSLFLISCVTQRPAIDEQKIDQKSLIYLWEAKAQLIEKNNNKKQQVSIDFVGQKSNKLRFDVNGPLGISLATFSLKDAKFQYILYRQKAFYEGEVSDKALRSVIKMDLNPLILHQICFDRPISDSGWSCQKDSAGMIAQCQQPSQGLSVQWRDRQGPLKRVVVQNADYELQIVFKDYKTKVLDPQSMQDPFHLDTPQDYTKHKIN